MMNEDLSFVVPKNSYSIFSEKIKDHEKKMRIRIQTAKGQEMHLGEKLFYGPLSSSSTPDEVNKMFMRITNLDYCFYVPDEFEKSNAESHL